MAVSYSISNTINYDTVGIGFENPSTTFPSIYGNSNFGYTVTFTTTDIGKQITNVAVLSSPIYTNETVLSVNSVRITRDINQDIFPNESYSLVEFDPDFAKTVIVLPPEDTNQAGSNGSVFRWDTPSQRVVRGSYTFRISSINTVIVPGTPDTIDTPGTPGTPDTTETFSATETVTYTQDFVWSLIPGTQALLELVSRSKY